MPRDRLAHLAPWLIDDKSWWAVQVPYDRVFVEQIKSEIDPHDRMYVKAERLWLVRAREEDVIRLLLHHFTRCPSCWIGELCDGWRRTLDDFGARSPGRFDSFGMAKLRAEFTWTRQPPSDQKRAAEILRIAPTASRAEIASAWRREVLAAHPDRGGSHDRVVAVNLARDLLLRLLDEQERGAQV